MSKIDQLNMLDSFGGRIRIIPAEVSGFYRRWRDRVYAVLVLIFLVLPWIKINGLQAVWIDIPKRRFEFFGIPFLAHDTPLIFLLVATFVLVLAFATAVWGRVWCGWACPQTVFIEGIYLRIERWVEGDYIARRKLQAEEMSPRKFFLLAIKWCAYFLVSTLIAHSFIAYFAGSHNLLAMMQRSPAENWSYFLIVAFVTALLLFNFGWFREQFCIIMCPYGRFQGALMDPLTKTILYDEKRGEPRKGTEAAGAARGDCVSCNRCVQVCPTGIDIREGVQMECIACTACIDACDEIMVKVKKPTGLIGYKTLRAPEPGERHLRPYAYSGLAGLLVAVLIFNIATRSPFAVALLRAPETPFQILQDGTVSNHFKLHLHNQSLDKQNFELALAGESEQAGVRLAQGKFSVEVPVGQSMEKHFFALIPKAMFNEKGEAHVQVRVTEQARGLEKTIDIKAVGPYKQ